MYVNSPTIPTFEQQNPYFLKMLSPTFALLFHSRSLVSLWLCCCMVKSHMADLKVNAQNCSKLYVLGNSQNLNSVWSWMNQCSYFAPFLISHKLKWLTFILAILAIGKKLKAATDFSVKGILERTFIWIAVDLNTAEKQKFYFLLQHLPKSTSLSYDFSGRQQEVDKSGPAWVRCWAVMVALISIG